MKLIIGDCNYSTWSMRPWLYVHKHRLPVNVERYGLDSGEIQLVLSGCFSNGKVPTLVDDDVEVWIRLPFWNTWVSVFRIHVPGRKIKKLGRSRGRYAQKCIPVLVPCAARLR